MTYTNITTKKANDYFNKGEFQNALSAYLELSRRMGENIFRTNIDLCKKKLKKEIPHEQQQVSINQYFDHIYVVNLKHQLEKRIKISQQLSTHNIQFELFNAVNGYAGDPLEKYKKYQEKPLGSLQRYPQWNEREIKRNAKYIESAGAVGYIYTYLQILNDAKEKGYKKFLILEDDIILCNNFHEKLDAFMQSVPTDWKILQLGASQYNWESVNYNLISEKGYYYPKQLDTCGSFAIAFDHSIIDELIEAESAFEAPFDHLPMGELYNRHYEKCFVAYPNIVMPDVGDSSIRGGRCQYTHGKRVKWHPENYLYPYPRPSVAIIISSPTNLKYWSSFSNHAILAVDLRLYYLSDDGPRPLHDISMLPDNYEFDINEPILYSLPNADYFLALDKNDILTEEHIYNYIENRLGLSDKESPLHPITIPTTSFFAGRVSVIIPTYKRPINLKNALISVIEQDYADIEIIVVSDNGQDSDFNNETRTIVGSLKSAHPKCNLKLIEHTQNRNGAAARNTGILQSTGEYICFLDDDDIYLPGRISNSISALKNSKGTDGAVYCGFLGWNSPENDLNRYKSGDLTLEILLLDYKKHYLHTNTATYKREAVLAINGFDESYRRHQDLEFNLRFFELYDIGVVKESGVRLNPEPSDVSNKVFNIEMLKLKTKFLGQFEKTIEELRQSGEVYDKHWSEVARYINDKKIANDYLKSYKKNGYLQVALALSEEK